MQVSPAEQTLIGLINKNGNVFGQNATIGRERMAQESGYTIGTCKKATKALEERHLLRVERKRLGPGRNAVNVYSLVRPWLRELSFHEAYIAKKRRELARQQEQKDTAHLASIHGRIPVIPRENKKEEKSAMGYLKPEEIPPCVDRGSPIWYLAQGLEPPRGEG
mgnify:CR=1 FL=1